MAAIAHPAPKGLPGILDSTPSLATLERTKSLILRAWIVAGLFFMALPGTLLGFSNLMAISAHHGLGGLSPAWLQGHGHAQVFGWIGSFILGIGFYSQPARGRSAARIQLLCFVLWSVGVALRWTANIYGWHWRVFVPLSAALELIAVLLFLSAASHHKIHNESAGSPKRRMELWMASVLLGTAGLAAAVLFNLVECVRLALAGASPAFPHAFDQKYLVILGWGFLVPVVWGFSARWLPAFLGLARPHVRLFSAALLLDAFGVAVGASGQAKIAVLLLAAAAILSGLALRLAERPYAKAKTQGIHASFPAFARIPYLWLAIAGAMSVWAAFCDVHGGIWGASRHALTVGFAATMVFAIGPRILPHFGGIYRIFSTRLMFASLLLLQIGCTLRVWSEPLAYESILPYAWKTLPISGMLELAGVLIFAANIALTFAFGRPAFAHHQAAPHAFKAKSEFA
ncbi:MAG TPA: hypothetical protein VME23_07055 [Terracidiphilus sp.]|nr:hypothetical protein [Terracidiphilus sp.]